jgi:acyl-CoA reductase-like NAD-dependent aldehyde dehydrogenase
MVAMDVRAHGNRLVGREVALEEGGRFEVRAVADGASLGTWPRSGVETLRRMLDELQDARAPLGGLDVEERLERALTVLDALSANAALAAWLAARLGLCAEELDRHRADLARRAERHLAPESGLRGGAAPAGIALAIPDWSELLIGTATAPLAELVLGRPVLVLADPRTPAVADAVADAIADAGFPPGTAAVLHGADAALLRAAVRSPSVTRAVVSGAPERLRAVHAAAAARAPSAALELLEDVPRGVAVTLGHDAPERAGEIVERALGRAATLSGQAPGRVEAVYCPPRAFSAFTEALLAALGDTPDVVRPIPLIDAEAVATFHEVCRRGLDEGATLIHGDVARGPAAAGAGGGSRIVAPAVFTNVESGMQILARVAPGPLLRLVRAEAENRSALR